MKRRIYKAFTLVELLVVISIIAMLLAILMPSLARARQQGKAVICLNNLRQMGIAAAAYTQSYNDYYPIAYYTTLFDNGQINYSWDFTFRYDSGVSTRLPGLLWQVQTIEKIQQCPVFKGTSNDSAPFTGYNYNTSYIGHGDGESIETPAKASMVRHSGGCALFGDGQWVGGANKYMRAPIGKSAPDCNSFSNRAAGAQGFRHLGRTNVAWADGHAASQDKCYTVADPSHEGDILNAYNRRNKTQKIGFLSPDNSAYDLE